MAETAKQRANREALERQRRGEQNPPAVPEPAVVLWPPNIDQEQRLLDERRRSLEGLRQNIIVANTEVTNAQTAVQNADDMTVDAAKTRLSNARLLLQGAENVYRNEQDAITNGMSAIEQLKLRYFEQYRKDHPNITPQEEEKFRVELERAHADTEWANTQRRVALADAERKAAQDEWDAAFRRAWTPEEAAAEEKAKTAATNRVNTANANYTTAQQAALDAALPFAGQSAEADANVRSAEAVIKAAEAGVAPRVAEAGAGTAEAGASKAASEAAIWDEKLAADVRNLIASGVLTETQAGEIAALLPQKLEYGKAQIAAEQAKTEFQRLQTHQLEVGDIQTKIEQLQNAVQQGMDPTQADALMEDYLSGSTRFERQKQRETQLSGAMTQALQYGMAVTPGQQYLPGAEPGGAYAQNFERLGMQMPSVQLTDAQPLQSFVASQGIQTQEPMAPARFGPTGSYTAAPAGVAQPTALPAPSGVMQPIRTVTADEFLAKARTPAQAAVQPAAGGGTYDLGGYGPYDTPIFGPDIPELEGSSVAGWEGFGGSSGIGTAPEIAGPYVIPLPLDPALNQARGGTTLPRAFLGVPGTTPRVDRKPIFRAARRDTKPPLFAGRRR